MDKADALGLERDEHLRRCDVLLLHFFGMDERFAQVKDGGFPHQVERDAYDLVFANPPFIVLRTIKQVVSKESGIIYGTLAVPGYCHTLERSK